MPVVLAMPYRLPIPLLPASNVFVTIAWHGCLRCKEVPLSAVILASCGIALLEYCRAVPANRWGSAVYKAAQLKTLHAVIALLVFAGFSIAYLKESIGWNHLVGFSLIAAGAFFVCQKWRTWPCRTARCPIFALQRVRFRGPRVRLSICGV